MQKKLLFLLSILSLQQCRSQEGAQISGKIALSENWKPVVYLLQPRHFNEIASSYSNALVDSAQIDAQGNFRLLLPKEKLQNPFFVLCVQPSGSRFFNKFIDEDPGLSNYIPLMAENGKSLIINAEAARLQASFRIENPDAANAAFLALRDLRAQAFGRERAWLGPNAVADEHNLMDQEAALLRFQHALIGFADTTTTYHAALLALRWASPESDYERIPEALAQQCEKWRSKNAGRPWLEELCQIGDRQKLPLMIGETIPDYPMPMSGGDTLMLQQLLGKKLTILDIWASWCMPCRRENREALAPLWSQYGQSGLQIIGYSIDAGAPAWRAAIQKDAAAWPQASHLSGDETPFMQTLQIATIPANFILDENGKVIAKNLHGDALKEFVEGYLQK